MGNDTICLINLSQWKPWKRKVAGLEVYYCVEREYLSITSDRVKIPKGYSLNCDIVKYEFKCLMVIWLYKLRLKIIDLKTRSIDEDTIFTWTSYNLNINTLDILIYGPISILNHDISAWALYSVTLLVWLYQTIYLQPINWIHVDGLLC